MLIYMSTSVLIRHGLILPGKQQSCPVPSLQIIIAALQPTQVLSEWRLCRNLLHCIPSSQNFHTSYLNLGTRRVPCWDLCGRWGRIQYSDIKIIPPAKDVFLAIAWILLLSLIFGDPGLCMV